MSKIAFLFPGQGAQTVGMGRQLVETCSAARQLFDQARAILGYDLAEVCFNGPAGKLDSTVYSQPALYVTSLAALEVLRRQTPELVRDCSAAAGLSLGEYTALTFAGVLDFEAGLKVVQRRGEAMQAASDATPSGMVSVLGLELPAVEAICREASQGAEYLRVSNLLSPGQIVCSGHQAACARAIELGVKAGAMKVLPLAVAGAFHTPIMESARPLLAEALQSVTLQRPRFPVISNVDAAAHDDPEEIRALLVEQVVSPVRWEESMRHLISQGWTQFTEVGPGRVLRGLLKRIDRSAQCDGVSC